MAERGASPNVPPTRRRLLRAAGVFFTPLLPDDYLELINPLWTTREVRGRIEAIEPETADSVTVVIRPGWVWEGHDPGQYLRVGVVVDGVHHWRAYSLTSDPGRPDGCEVLCRLFDDIHERRVLSRDDEDLLRHAWRQAHPVPAYFRRRR